MAFLNVLFPTRVSDGSSGGPMYKTHLLEYESGYESTDQKWPYPRMRFEVNAGTLDADEIEELYQFFWVVAKGRANTFLFEDPWDHKSVSYSSTIAATDQVVSIGTIASTLATVKIEKTYESNGYTQVREILSPVVSTLVFSVNGSTRTTGFTHNASTGRVIFSPALASTVTSVRCGFHFYNRVRFNQDDLQTTLEGGIIGNARVSLIERKGTG